METVENMLTVALGLALSSVPAVAAAADHPTRPAAAVCHAPRPPDRVCQYLTHPIAKCVCDPVTHYCRWVTGCATVPADQRSGARRGAQ